MMLDYVSKSTMALISVFAFMILIMLPTFSSAGDPLTLHPTDTITVQIINEVDLKQETIDYSIQGLMSTERVLGSETYFINFEGWQGVFDEINDKYPDNKVPDKIVFVEKNADIRLIFTNEIFVINGVLGRYDLTEHDKSLYVYVDTSKFWNRNGLDESIKGTVMHEFGHALGLEHHQDKTQVMSDCAGYCTISTDYVDILNEKYKELESSG